MNPHIQVPYVGAKWVIGFTGLFHLAVAALAIGFAFVVTVFQIVGYMRRERQYDLLAKRVQLVHVCIYNIGTVVAIGLVFALSGLFPQFWSQIFVTLFWTIMVEEFLFFLLATTLTFHYFFWEHIWGHKKLHILLGALLTPLFLLQFYIINGMGGFMLTPDYAAGELSLRTGVLGWDAKAFFNPSLLALTVHRGLANVAYGAFIVAAFCGIGLYLHKQERVRKFLLDGGRLAYWIGFIAFLSLPIVGFFYAVVLRDYANEAYWNLMRGKGDVVAGGIDWWWLKHVFVAGMLGISFAYFRRGAKEEQPFGIPAVLVYGIVLFYVMFYLFMGMVMTWTFFWVMLGVGAVGALLARHLLNYHDGSPRGVYFVVGMLSFMTVMLGGYVREASRPRFTDRIAAYNDIYVPEDREQYLMVPVKPGEIPPPPPPETVPPAVKLIRRNCVGCHTLERVRKYPREDWDSQVELMRAYGAHISEQEARTIADFLKSGKPY